MSKSLLGTYLRFLRSPNLSAPPITIAKHKAVKSILCLYSVHLMALLVLLVIIGQIPAAQDSNNLLDALTDSPVWYLPVMAIIVAPLLEECIFRLPLRAFALNLLLPVSLVISVSLGWVAPGGLGFVAIALVNVYLGIKGTKLTKLQAFYNKFPHVIFYGIALLFGVIHITNYDFDVWKFLPVLVLPQIVIGLLLGFVRLRYGFVWGFLLHALHNGALLLPVTFVQLFGSKQLQANLTESIDLETLSRADQIVAGAVGLYSVAGILLCAVIAWKVVREWIHISNYDTNTGTRL